MARRDPRSTGLHAGLVDELVRHGHARHPSVVAAFRDVPRSHFLPGRSLASVYANESVVTKRRRDGLPLSSSTEPGLMARMLDQLQVQPGQSVLEIGAGSGYNAAILARLTSPNGSVTSVELDPDTARRARRNLTRAGYDTVEVIEGDGWFGAPGHAPYDRIQMTVGIWDVSRHWVAGLRRGGLLLVPLWLRGGLQVSVAFTGDGDELHSVSVQHCGFMRFRGSHAGPEGYASFRGWIASLDLLELAAPMRALTEADPSLHPAGGVPAHAVDWHPRFLLDEPGAVSVVREADNRPSVGLIHPNQRSFALLDNDHILVFGTDEARVSLIRGALRARPLEITRLRVRASRTAGSIDETTGWTVTRPNFRFTITEGTSAPRRQ